MYEEELQGDIFFIMLYGAAAMLSLAACSTPIQTDIAEDEDNTLSLSMRHRSASPLGLSKNIEPLLKQYCEESRLYLQQFGRFLIEINLRNLY